MKISQARIAGSVSFIILAALLLTAVACAPHEAPRSEGRIGDPTVAGSLTFNVVEARWRSQLDGFPTPRMPERNFLLVKLTVTNGGGSEASIPYLQVRNADGQVFSESEDGTGLDGWMGMIRRVAPAQTEEGWLLFDVPSNSYKLRVTDGNVENEHVAFISIPLSMQTDAQGPRVP